jgi:restriction system protein
MTSYWVISPYDSSRPQIFDKAWKYDLENGTIALGWRELGDISDIENKSELEARYRKAYGDDVPQQVVTRDVNSLWTFRHGIPPGDKVIARHGTKRLIGIGTVTGQPFYDEEKGQERVENLTEDFYSRFLTVNWEEREEIEFEQIVFSFYTIYEIPEEKYRDLIQEEGPSEESDGLTIPEKHLEDFIVRNFDQIFQGQLELYKDEGAVGQQYPIVSTEGKAIGYIDILAKEPGTDSYVVIELKRGRGSDRVVGQVLRYIGWVAENLCQTEEKVKGLIICREGSENLDYALKMVEAFIEVNRYRVDFQLID